MRMIKQMWSNVNIWIICIQYIKELFFTILVTSKSEVISMWKVKKKKNQSGLKIIFDKYQHPLVRDEDSKNQNNHTIN